MIGVLTGFAPVPALAAAGVPCTGDVLQGPIMVSTDPHFTDGNVTGPQSNFTIGHFRFIANAAFGADYSIFTMSAKINGNADALINPKISYSRYPTTTSSAWIGAEGYGYENADGSWTAEDLRIDLKRCQMVDVWVTADVAPTGWNGVAAGDTVQVELISDADHPFGSFVRSSTDRLDESDVQFDVLGPTFTIGE